MPQALHYALGNTTALSARRVIMSALSFGISMGACWPNTAAKLLRL
jgi:hypothetical protein